MSDEQRVRTTAGWIGVEISKSRVRTPGRAGYGMYRVRGSRPIARALGTIGPDMKSYERTDWTAYAFTLEEIAAGVEEAIGVGIPEAPADLWLRPAAGGNRLGVTTRWTSAYTGRRDLGVPSVREEEADLLASVMAELLGEGLLEMRHAGPDCACAPGLVDRACAAVMLLNPHARGLARSRRAEMERAATSQGRQRAANAEFQAEHLKRREWGLRQRYARKEQHNRSRLDGQGGTGA